MNAVKSTALNTYLGWWNSEWSLSCVLAMACPEMQECRYCFSSWPTWRQCISGENPFEWCLEKHRQRRKFLQLVPQDHHRTLARSSWKSRAPTNLGADQVSWAAGLWTGSFRVLCLPQFLSVWSELSPAWKNQYSGKQTTGRPQTEMEKAI